MNEYFFFVLLFLDDQHNGYDHRKSYTVSANDCVDKGTSFCTEVRNYPNLKHFENIINRDFPFVRQLLSQDDALPQDIRERMNISPSEESLCRSHEKVIYPKAGETTTANWSYILNNERFKQGVRIEECEYEQQNIYIYIQNNNTNIIIINIFFRFFLFFFCRADGSSCSSSISLPNGYEVTCKQHYIYRSLVSLTADGKITNDLFKMPSCCKCMLKYNAGI